MAEFKTIDAYSALVIRRLKANDESMGQDFLGDITRLTLDKTISPDARVAALEERDISLCKGMGVDPWGERPPFTSFPGYKPEADVKREAKAFMEVISSEWNYLRAILASYEQLLHKRWKKKNVEQRKKIILQSWPDIPSMHRPDFYAVQRVSDRNQSDLLNLRDYFLLPHLNLEDLATTRLLLLMFDSRGRYKPERFAVADINSVHLGTTTKELALIECPALYMILTAQKSSEPYGHMVNGVEDPFEYISMTTDGLAVFPGKGLLALEIQQRTLQFLNKCAKGILHDLALNDMDDRVILGSSPFNEDSFRDECLSWTLANSEAPYRVPDKFDFARLCSCIQAKRTEAEDHLWALREDPGYFEDIMCTAREHDVGLESVKDTVRTSYHWKLALASAMADAYASIWLWEVTWRNFNELVLIKERHVDGIAQGKRMPEDWKQALAHFSYQVQQVLQFLLKAFKNVVTVSPQLRGCFIWDFKAESVVVRKKQGDRLLWLVAELMDISKTLQLVGLHSLLSELENTIENDHKERQRLSSVAVAIVSHLGLLAEIWRQISLSFPGPSFTSAVPHSIVTARASDRAATMNKLLLPVDEIARSSKIALPLQRLKYPSDVRRTVAVTHEMQKAERQLDLFWKRFDNYISEKTGETVDSLLPEPVVRRSLHRTPDWIKPEKRLPAKTDQGQASLESLLITNFNDGARNTLKLEISSPLKVKAKTRGVAAAEPGTLNDPNMLEKEDRERLEAPDNPRFTVGPREYKVFASLFHSPTEDCVPGELPWHEFLRAMTSIGFFARKLHGSAWYFSPPDNSRSITFHEPHPASKVPFVWVRRFGRRLDRAYGWTKESFSRA